MNIRKYGDYDARDNTGQFLYDLVSIKGVNEGIEEIAQKAIEAGTISIEDWQAILFAPYQEGFEPDTRIYLTGRIPLNED